MALMTSLMSDRSTKVPSQNFLRIVQGVSTLETMQLAIDDLTGMVKGMAGSLKTWQSEVKIMRTEVKELRLPVTNF